MFVKCVKTLHLNVNVCNKKGESKKSIRVETGSRSQTDSRSKTQVTDHWQFIKDHTDINKHTHLFLFAVYDHQISSFIHTVSPALRPSFPLSGFKVTAASKSRPSIRTLLLKSNTCFKDRFCVMLYHINKICNFSI